MNRSPFLFNDKKVSRLIWLETARQLRGVRGSKIRNFVSRTQDGQIDTERSSLRCDGVVLWTARECGLLAPDCDLSAARVQDGQSLEDAALAFLEANFVQATKRASRRGDVLFMRYSALFPSLPTHLAILTCASDATRALLHVEGPQSRVVEIPCDALDWARVHSVWRPKAFPS